MCTQEYRILTISVKDQASNPVLLDQYFVVKSSTGEMIDFSQEDPFTDSINRLNGIYTLMTDGRMEMTSRAGVEFVFHGRIGNAEIVNEKYIIANDACHVSLVSGKTEVIPASGSSLQVN